MSNLNSQFQVLAGLPPNGKSAMSNNFKEKAVPTITLTEGIVAAVEDESDVPVLDAMSSAAITTGDPDYPWLVIQGTDQWDSAFVDNVACVSMKTGLIFKIDTAISVAVGDMVYAVAGVLAKVTAGIDKQAVGQVLEVNTTSEYIVVAT